MPPVAQKDTLIPHLTCLHCFFTSSISLPMKSPRLERLARRMREHHRHHPWSLSEGGLYIPHAYHDMKPDDLSHWDHVGFVLNGRRYMVSWRHPRYLHASAIAALARQQQRTEHGEPPAPFGVSGNAAKRPQNDIPSGRQKKPRRSERWDLSDDWTRYQEQLTARTTVLRKLGIDLKVSPSWKWKRYEHCMGIDLVAPVEVRNEQELAQLAELARQLVNGQTTLAERFPGAVYGQSDWLREQSKLHP